MASTSNANPRNLSAGGGSRAIPPGVRTYGSTDARVNDKTNDGILRVVSNQELTDNENEEARLDVEAQEASKFQKDQNIAGYVRQRFYDFRDIRETRGISIRLLEALRAYRGEYPPSKLAEITKFGGSTVYSRLTALKCRGATAMLRDIYLSGERPWFVEPTPVPTLPQDITSSMLELVNAEMRNAEQGGQPATQEQVQDRIQQLTASAMKASKAKATEMAEASTEKLDDLLVEGGFYDSLTEFLHYLTVFPFALMKGPVVRMATDVKWEDGEAVVKDLPKMYWTSPNPFDIYWASGVRDFNNTDIIEHMRLSRGELDNLIGIPGYNEDAIRNVLDQYGQGGLSDWMEYTDTERAQMEMREDPHINRSDVIDALEFHGKIQGRMLLEYGYDPGEIEDPETDYFCTCWVIGQYVIKVQIDPNPRKRHPYYKTSFEKIPGGIIGFGIPEIIADIQDVANATLRALVNNLSIASGPQVIVNDSRAAPNADTDSLYPWKRWHTQDDPMSSNDPAVAFFQPQSNSQELLATYQQMTIIADEISAIPRYMTGSDRVGGAGRTASGLNMLMQNAGKVLQSVAANVDADVFSPLLQRLYDTVLLTDQEGSLKGDEQIRVRGVTFANQRETERTRMLEFLQLTSNPMDAQIVGMGGRAELLREIADRVGLDGAEIVPDKGTVAAKEKQANMQQALAGGTPGGKPPPEAGAVNEGIQGSRRGPSGNI